MAETFRSILFVDGARVAPDSAPPDILGDLNLDQIIKGVTASREEYDLKPFFYAPLSEANAILYRQEVIADLEGEGLRRLVEEFAAAMRRIREELVRADKLSYKLQKHWWFVDAVGVYCRVVSALAAGLEGIAVASRGLKAFREYLAGLATTESFRSLGTEATRLRERLATIRYSLIIKDDSLSVRAFEDEQDYSVVVEATFRKFAQGEGKEYRVPFRETIELNHVEAAALDFVARLNPELFSELDLFCTGRADFPDPVIQRFDREVQFYLSYLDYVRGLREAGLSFVTPELAIADKRVAVTAGFDLALAKKLAGTGHEIVCNDFHLDGRERIIIVSGPNNGGKTTFARMFGQMHYLALLGLKVPGREARLLLSDAVFTHFEREEKIENLRSKFEEDLLRVHDILRRASGRSIIVMNESFSSTSLQDAAFIGRQVVRRVIEKDLICLFVTFVEELARLGDTGVSMASTIVPGDPASRTYKIVRRAADGRAYAIAVAEKYGLTYRQLRERIGA
ncbi:MAG: MutS-related protein [Acetobacteraceae bacterium]